VNATFQYDALGRRISKTINGVATIYLYDGNDIVAEIGGSAVSATYLRSLSIDEPFVRQMASGNEFYHTDALGSSLALTNGGGATVVSYSYEPFGKTTVTGTSSNPFQYTGRENEGAGLYYYRARYHSPQFDRFLSEDPILLPFTPSSVGFCGAVNSNVWRLPWMISNLQSELPRQLNPYAYVLNNPLLLNDPLGLQQGPNTNQDPKKYPCVQEEGQCFASLPTYPKDSPERKCFDKIQSNVRTLCAGMYYNTCMTRWVLESGCSAVFTTTACRTDWFGCLYGR
jgi:RHS repeat-associated protein